MFSVGHHLRAQKEILYSSKASEVLEILYLDFFGPSILHRMDANISFRAGIHSADSCGSFRLQIRQLRQSSKRYAAISSHILAFPVTSRQTTAIHSPTHCSKRCATGYRYHAKRYQRTITGRISQKDFTWILGDSCEQCCRIRRTRVPGAKNYHG